jgi:Na+-translocating ferredoxin:NAD+ oxidoreductase subunit E
MTFKDFVSGLWEQNQIFRIILGMCPTLAITTLAINGLFMGLAVIFVLVLSSVTVSLIRNLVPSKIRIPVFVIIIATIVTVADYILSAYFSGIHKVLGIYLPLIVVNCIILGRIEVFAKSHTVGRSFLDALGMGLGYTWGLILLGSIREFVGSGTLFGFTIFGNWYPQVLIMRLPTGAFITLALVITVMNIIKKRKPVPA